LTPAPYRAIINADTGALEEAAVTAAMEEAAIDLCAAAGCLLFVSREPVPAPRLAGALGISPGELPALMEALAGRLQGQGLQVMLLAGGYSLATREEYAETVRVFLEPKPEQLSKAALETLAIIAYRQPITRPQVEQIRGVGSAGVVRALLERGLVKTAGRDQAPGRPFLFTTTPEFLSLFGLASLEDLPPLGEDLAAALAQTAAADGGPEQGAAEEEAPFEFEA